MIKKLPYLLFIAFITNLYAQKKTVIELRADGPGNTYKLIDSKFGNGGQYSAIEAPGKKVGECDNHSTYKNQEGTSDHITEVYDKEKGNVFQFELHLKEDKDRHKCGNRDRQRNEIKGFNGSPDGLKGNIGETVIYEWSMKLPKDFQLSRHFTHFHQIKSVGGIKDEEKIPLLTITGYKRDKEEIHIRYSEKYEQETLIKLNFNDFKGHWITFTETIHYKKGKGNYELRIENVKDKKVLLDYKNKLLTYKKDAKFMRPKWGIYRKITESKNLKDEKVLFGHFKITEID